MVKLGRAQQAYFSGQDQDALALLTNLRISAAAKGYPGRRVRLLLADLYARGGDYPQARQMLGELEALGGETGLAARFGRGWVELAAGNLDGALAEFEATASLATGNLQVYGEFSKGLVLAGKGNHLAAKAAFSHVADNAVGEDLRAHALLLGARAAIRSGDAQTALAELESLLLELEDSTLLDDAERDVGWARYASEDYLEARAQFERVGGSFASTRFEKLEPAVVTNAAHKPASEVLKVLVAGYQSSGRRLERPNPVLSLLDLLDNYAAGEAAEGIAACDAALQ